MEGGDGTPKHDAIFVNILGEEFPATISERHEQTGRMTLVVAGPDGDFVLSDMRECSGEDDRYCAKRVATT